MSKTRKEWTCFAFGACGHVERHKHRERERERDRGAERQRTVIHVPVHTRVT
jgi:hypothetical protein